MLYVRSGVNCEFLYICTLYIHAAHVSTVAEMPVRLRMLIQYLCPVACTLNNRCACVWTRVIMSATESERKPLKRKKRKQLKELHISNPSKSSFNCKREFQSLTTQFKMQHNHTDSVTVWVTCVAML